jgi:hypothetical protein
LASVTSIDLGSFKTRTAAANIYVQCFPLMLADAIRRCHRLGFQHFQILADDGGRLAPGLAEDDPLVILASAWVDVGADPAVLRLPHARGRYFNTTLMDSAGEPFASFGARTGDDAGADWALVGPRWRGELPGGVKAKRSPSDGVWVVSRLRAHSSLDQSAALALVKRLCIASLRRRPDPPQAALSTPEPRLQSCIRQVEEMGPAAFFDRLDGVLERAPAGLRQSVLERVSALKAELGGPPKLQDWTPKFAQAVKAGLEEGAAAVRAAASPLARSAANEPRALLGAGAADALTRAARAYASMGAPLPEDQIRLECAHDSMGRPLSGGHAYRLHFARSALPPVHGFWRFSTRPGEGAGARSGLGSRSDLALNPDGSLDVLLQADPPGLEWTSNWLPTPRGAWSLVLRLYYPHSSVISGAWRMPPLDRIAAGAATERPVRSRFQPAFHAPMRAGFGRRFLSGTSS